MIMLLYTTYWTEIAIVLGVGQFTLVEQALLPVRVNLAEI
jgi:hypothetical protein